MTDAGGDHPQGYCQITCGRCNGGGGNNNGGNNNNNSGGQQTGKGANGQTCPCTDTQPDGSASCQQQVRWLQAPRHTASCTLRTAWLPGIYLRNQLDIASSAPHQSEHCLDATVSQASVTCAESWCMQRWPGLVRSGRPLKLVLPVKLGRGSLADSALRAGRLGQLRAGLHDQPDRRQPLRPLHENLRPLQRVLLSAAAASAWAGSAGRGARAAAGRRARCEALHGKGAADGHPGLLRGFAPQQCWSCRASVVLLLGCWAADAKCTGCHAE